MSVKQNILSSILIIAVYFFSSCKVSQPSAYFKTLQRDTTLKAFAATTFEPKIVKGDRLSIHVSSLNPAEDLVFNAPANEKDFKGYLVDEDGKLSFHKLGKLDVEGMTRKQFSIKLEQELAPFLKDAVVGVQFINQKVTVMGAVRNPQVLNMPDGKMTLLDALVLSGDAQPEANRKKVLLIRDADGERKVFTLNLEDHSIFTSPFYYLQPNDIVYLAADTEQKLKDEKRQRVQSTLALAASGASLLVIILDRILR